MPAVSGANFTGNGWWCFREGRIGVTTLTPVGIETSTVTRKDLMMMMMWNYSTGAGSSFHAAYMGDGFLSFNTEFSSSSGYYISTFTTGFLSSNAVGLT